MTLDAIRAGIAAQGLEHVLNSLPSWEALEWTPLPLAEADPPTGLRIGMDSRRDDIIAFQSNIRTSQGQISYCSQGTRSRTNVPQAALVKMLLYAPFKYIADASPDSKSWLTVVVAWYLLFMSPPPVKQMGDCENFCRVFAAALRRIDEKRREEQGSSGERPGSSTGDSLIGEESVEIEQSRSPYGLRSAGRGNLSNSQGTFLTTAPLPTPSEELSFTRGSGTESLDALKIRQYLVSKNVSGLLKNIPTAQEVDWADQSSFDTSLPKKLFVGHALEPRTEPRVEIYAFLKVYKDVSEVTFRYQAPGGKLKTMRAEEVAKQDLKHPFNKTLYEGASELTRAARTKLSVLVKWYFLSAGLAPKIPFDPSILELALKHIENRMAVLRQNPSLATPRATTTPSGTPGRRASSPIIIVATPAVRISPPVTPSILSEPSSVAQPGPLQAPKSRRGAKRSREEAELEGPCSAEHQNNLTLAEELTRKIEDDEQELKRKDEMEHEMKNRQESLKKQMEELERKINEEITKEDNLEIDREVIRSRKEKNKTERNQLNRKIMSYYAEKYPTDD